jgi:hypothetical protein
LGSAFCVERGVEMIKPAAPLDAPQAFYEHDAASQSIHHPIIGIAKG